MKRIYYFLTAAVILITSACTEPDDLMSTNAVEGGLLEVMTPSLNYVVGDGKTYTVEFRVLQSTKITTDKVDVFISFNTFKRDAAGAVVLDEDGNKTALVSNEKLFKTITVSDKLTHFETFSADYSQLIEGLTVDGNALSTNDGDLLIGDNWNFRLESTTSEGLVHENYKSVSVAVSTRFAGTYKVIAGDYFRLGVDNGPNMWVGETVTISSIDAITYKFDDWGALSGWGGNVLYFQIDAANSSITYPQNWAGTDQTLNGEPLTTPVRNPNDLTAVTPLAGAAINTAIKDDVNGKDQLNMVHGYYTGGSGPREFYFLLEKQ